MTFSAARTQATRGPWGQAVQGLESASCTGEPGKDPSPWQRFSSGDANQALQRKPGESVHYQESRSPNCARSHNIQCSVNSSENVRPGATATSTEQGAGRSGA